MSSPYTHNMSERVWYWPRESNDGDGGIIFGSPEERYVRWQDTSEVVSDKDGRQIASSAVVYVDSPVAVEGMLWRSSSEYPDDEPPSDAREIIRVGSSPSLDQTVELHKAWLK